MPKQFVSLTALFVALSLGGSASAQTADANADRQPPRAAAYPDDLALVARFSGRVTGPDGAPVPNARIYLAPNKSVSTATLSEGGSALLNPIETLGPVRAETDADGRFEFDALDMAYTAVDGQPVRRQGLLVAAADGFAPDWMTTWGDNSAYGSHWDPVPGAPMELQLDELGAPIEGRLLDPRGRPLSGALVRVTKLMIPEDRDLDAHLAHEARGYGLFSGPDYEATISQPELIPGLETETRSNADGRFTLAGLGRDRLAVLEITEPRVANAAVTVMTREAPEPAAQPDEDESSGKLRAAKFTLQLEPDRTVKGRVVDRDTGEPVPGMWVGPRQNHYAGVAPTLFRGRSDEDGQFTLNGLPAKLPLGEIIMAVSPPGGHYQTVGAWIVGNAEVEIKCPRGIPFRLNVVDEQGRPVDADVTYADLEPNPHVENLVPWGMDVDQYFYPNAPAARRAPGVYEGFVLPGPGAVLVQTPRSGGYRPARVDPKAFFAPSRTDWSSADDWAYGTTELLATPHTGIEQENYAAIVLVNAAPGSDPLELSATVIKDRPRQVSLVDVDGQPVDVEIWRGRSRRDAASFLLTGLHPDRVRPLTYFNEDRKLVGVLLARGDDVTPCTVGMQPWASIGGRVVDAAGKPLSGAVVAVTSDHPADVERHLGARTDDEGRFLIDKLVPGHNYRAKIFFRRQNIKGRLYNLFIGPAFDGAELRPAESRDLGDVATHTPRYEEFPLVYQ